MIVWIENIVVAVVVLLALAWTGRRLFLWWRRMRAFGQGDDASPCVACTHGGPSGCSACSLVDESHKPNFDLRKAPVLSYHTSSDGDAERTETPEIKG